MNCLKRQESRNSSDVSGRSSWNRDDDDAQEDTRWNRRNDGVGYKSNDGGYGNNDGVGYRRSDGVGYRSSDGVGYRSNDGAGYRSDQYGDYGRDNQRFEDYSNTYKSSTQQPRRFRRERRLDIKSAQRSQYNPNSSRKGSSYEDSYRRDDKNSSSRNISRESNTKACVFHCFMDELEMTGDNGIPDRYLVTNVLTKNVKNDELKDFLQESIEECFQILYNENSQDKCEFSKNLIMCLSEKGRETCDDWKDDKRF